MKGAPRKTLEEDEEATEEQIKQLEKRFDKAEDKLKDPKIQKILMQYDIDGDGVFSPQEVMLITEHLEESKKREQNMILMLEVETVCGIFLYLVTLGVIFVLVSAGNELSVKNDGTYCNH